MFENTVPGTVFSKNFDDRPGSSQTRGGSSDDSLQVKIRIHVSDSVSNLEILCYHFRLLHCIIVDKLYYKGIRRLFHYYISILLINVGFAVY